MGVIHSNNTWLETCFHLSCGLATGQFPKRLDSQFNKLGAERVKKPCEIAVIGRKSAK